MRTPDEMFALFNKIAREDDRIRVMTLEGSRVNPNVKPDLWQDYDITFLVTEMESYLQSDEWLKVFEEEDKPETKRIFMQKPEAMDLFPVDIPNGWFSYLMLFEDGVKIDLTLIPVEDVENYLQQDPLIRVLLDKDGSVKDVPEPTDELFWIQKPSAAFVKDCANEFLMVSTYVAKGLLRGELLFAQNIFEEVFRVELHRMLGYLAGVRRGFPINTGKRNKWLPQFLTEEERQLMCTTLRLDSLENIWCALYAAMDLFKKAMQEICSALAYPYPYDVDAMRNYIEKLIKMADRS